MIRGDAVNQDADFPGLLDFVHSEEAAEDILAIGLAHVKLQSMNICGNWFFRPLLQLWHILSSN